MNIEIATKFSNSLLHLPELQRILRLFHYRLFISLAYNELGYEAEELTQKITIRRLGKLRVISFNQAPISGSLYTLDAKDKPSFVTASGVSLYFFCLYESVAPYKYFPGYLQISPTDLKFYAKYVSPTANTVVTATNGSVYSTFAYMTD